MRLASIVLDGWELEDGEAYHAAAPTTFQIPDVARRQNLRRADFAKLMFNLAFAEPPTVERMWVVVTANLGDGRYLGILDNEPRTVRENDHLWVEDEVAFEARHIVDLMAGDAASLATAERGPRKRWRGLDG